MHRQVAARELAEQLDLRQDLQLQGRDLRKFDSDPEGFFEWAESDPWLPRHKWLIWFSRVSPAVAIVTGILFLAGWLPATISLASGIGQHHCFVSIS